MTNIYSRLGIITRLLFVSLSLYSWQAFAQQPLVSDNFTESAALARLQGLEFNNVRCVIDEDTLIFSIENREYRSDAEAIAVALHEFLPDAAHLSKISLVYLELNIPVMKVDLMIPDNFNPDSLDNSELFWHDHLYYSYSTTIEWKKLLKSPSLSGTPGKFDLEFEPRIGFQLGDFTIPFRYEISMYPSLISYLWKGAVFQATAYVPIYNYEFVNKYKYSRPAIISLTQQFKLFDGHFLKLSTGLYTNNRYGLDGELSSYLLHGALILKASAAFTGQARYLKAGHAGFMGEIATEDIFEYTTPSYFSYQFSAEARIPYTEVAVQYGYGKYLYYANGNKVLIYRNFNEYILGLQAFWSDAGKNFGFYVSLPLIPSKYYFNKKIRVKPSKYLNYSYLATSDYYWYFRTGYDVSTEYLEVNPQVIMNQLPNYLLYVNEKESKLK